ncbi:1-deoxy-D-xylulose-5-phosphate reductoisomerase [Mariniblastus fucicola]|uniref:1-deoxy-D-xylulose 5-phosphate reductoisomerase n=1 Tax=Mariniblastus fucicola TaxID=980251 RepID=A0A5B9P7S0_9BACT|nr:1-deoxy-D-xylulose-5-phosphate reductoisomerase [Mariniblastus fucicola]QEG20982.1 1-deoxy-D-xylulose 5-phosphate reductoisomerase [Mariniblastus fucicola]
MTQPKRISILGVTGSIGQSTLDVVRQTDGMSVFAMSGHSALESLVEAAKEFQPKFVVATSQSAADGFDFGDLPAGTELLVGSHHIAQIASAPEVDVVVAAIVGIAGLPGTMAAVEAGKTVALANKESLVVAGSLITAMAASSGSRILPVDSEHSAVFQALQSGQPNEVSRIVLTASGGPFRDFSDSELKTVTVEQALAHPTWQMGDKISVDSATMMNKALEVIEARWLFDLPAAKIEVVVHPQSIVHSMVEFVDHSTVAQLSPPDMRLPIQYALTWPDRIAGVSPPLDLSRPQTLEFIPPDTDRFPALKLGFDVAARGGTSGAVLNAANESAVAAFLKRELSFTDIAIACQEILEQHDFIADPNLEQLMACDQWARQELAKWISV